MAEKIMTDSELETIYADMCAQTAVTGKNAYENYIEVLKASQSQKLNQAGKKLPNVETHHIIPYHDGGQDVDDNRVLVTIKEHVVAHWLRWKVFGQVGDQRAYLFRIGDADERVELRKQIVREARAKDKADSKGMFNSGWQSQMGQRGGPRGGSANTPVQFAARQQVGQTYGRQTGISNQKTEMVVFLSNFTIWAYKGDVADAQNKDANQESERFLLVGPQSAFIDVVGLLNQQAPGSVRKPPAMHKVVYGTRKQMYGWRIVSTLTRSEVWTGLEEFTAANPNAELIFAQGADSELFE